MLRTEEGDRERESFATEKELIESMREKDTLMKIPSHRSRARSEVTSRVSSGIKRGWIYSSNTFVPTVCALEDQEREDRSFNQPETIHS